MKKQSKYFGKEAKLITPKAHGKYSSFVENGERVRLWKFLFKFGILERYPKSF